MFFGKILECSRKKKLRKDYFSFRYVLDNSTFLPFSEESSTNPTFGRFFLSHFLAKNICGRHSIDALLLRELLSTCAVS